MITLKKITALLLLFPSFYSMADEANLKKMIEASYPKYKVESIKKTSYSGLYEVFMGGQIVYTDEIDYNSNGRKVNRRINKWKKDVLISYEIDKSKVIKF